MSEINYIKAQRVYNELYYQFTKAFIESDIYKNLSDGAKIAYMLLKARSEIVIYKDQVDENDNIYFEFTNLELQQMLNCGSQKVSHIKKELEDFQLLKQVKMGFNKKTGKNEKNRLYLAELNVTEKDRYMMQKREQTLGKSGLVNITSRSMSEESPETFGMGGDVKITFPKKTVKRLRITDL
ncbi:replication initiator protein A [Enterococcus gilvus]|uniref:replication initiator protein A n=1 Tax=Enterococcus gilvus TaxID=160453 RepID=UPI003ED97AD5